MSSSPTAPAVQRWPSLPGGEGPTAPPPPAVERNRLGFCLFLAVTAALFVRPAEVFEPLLGAEIYLYLILACLAVSFPAVLPWLSPAAIEKQPITVCVVGMLPAIVLSLLANAYFAAAWKEACDYGKVLIYYFLLLALVDSPARLRIFLSWLALCIGGMALLSILDYHGIRSLPKTSTSTGMEEAYQPQNVDDGPVVRRMVGTGLFNDPNDLCVLLVVGVMLALYRLADVRSGVRRVLWLVPLALFAYGFSLTQSRGGMLALLVGLGVTVRLRYGWGRALLLGGLAFPVLGAFLGARQMDVSTSADTATTRIQLWSDGLTMFRGAPLFGIGIWHSGDKQAHVAHNGYLTAFSELGLLGGTLFLGATFLATWSLYRLTWPPPRVPGLPAPPPRKLLDPELRAMHPFLAGALAAYAAGMVSLSLTYVAVTYALFGLAAVFVPLAVTHPPRTLPRFDGPMVVRLGLVAAGFLLATQVFVRVFFVG